MKGFLSVVSFVTAVALVSCAGGSTAPSADEAASRGLRGYVATAFNGAIFVRWMEANGTITGTLYWTGLDRASADGIRSESGDFTATRSGNQLTLNFPEGFGLSSTLAGLFSGAALTLYVPTESGVITPVVLRPGTLAEYNAGVLALRERLGRETAQALAVQTEEQRAGEQTAAAAGAATAEAEGLRRAAYERACTAHHGYLHADSGECRVNYPGGYYDGERVTLKPDGSWDQAWADENRMACEDLRDAGFNAEYHEDTGVCR